MFALIILAAIGLISLLVALVVLVAARFYTIRILIGGKDDAGSPDA